MSAPSTAPIGTKYGVPGKMWAAGRHTGIDFLCPTGSTLKAPVLSKIIHAGPNSSTGWGAAYGIHVIGECKVGGVTYRWITAHMRSVSVKAGQTVRRGMNLGYSNATGNVTGPHCHFEVRKGTFAYGKDVNPSVLLSVVTDGASTDQMDPAAYFLGAYGPHVTWLGTRLELHLAARGLRSPYKAGPGPMFTEVDRGAVTALQLALGFRGKDADGFPGLTTLKVLAGATPTTPPPAVKFHDATAFSINCGGYDTVGKGKATAVDRVPSLAAQAVKRKPLWVHYQECSAPMLSAMDKAMKTAGYKRLTLIDPSGKSASGAGRQSYYRTDAGITILGRVVRNVAHELDGDNKPFILVAWQVDGYKGVDANFHNENQGDAVQKSQLEDVEAWAIKWADKYGVRHGNILVTGDSNRKESVAEQAIRNWMDVGAKAPTSVGEEYHSTNGWKGKTKGRRIDVDMVRYNTSLAEYEQVFDKIVSDHWGRYTRRLLLPTL